MPVRLVLDEDSRDSGLLNAIRTLSSAWSCTVDIVRIGDEGAPGFGARDEEILQWAIGAGRTPVTHDFTTMIASHSELVYSGVQTTGLLVWRSGFTYSVIAEELVCIACCMEPEELAGHHRFIPF